MPNSLKCRLKKFVHKGLLSEKDLSRLYTDNDVIEELEKIKAEIKVNARGEYDFEGYCREEKISIKEVDKIIDNHIAELKGEQE